MHSVCHTTIADIIGKWATGRLSFLEPTTHTRPASKHRMQMQVEAVKLYAASAWPDMVGRHKGRSERGRSGAATYNAQVQSSASRKEASHYPAAKALLFGLPY